MINIICCFDKQMRIYIYNKKENNDTNQKEANTIHYEYVYAKAKKHPRITTLNKN